ncbi:MAG: YggS family pyridoxal phosphate-dependent enzyme [Thermotogota bacterium]|nr:YggS family pyridoxal phosphate-dependent enzyme [Thermotogota bacterium]
MVNIAKNVEKIRSKVPDNVRILAAAKTRKAEEIIEVVRAGITDIGENYVQETEEVFEKVNRSTDEKITWHMIGHLQRNKVKDALKLYDVIQSLDSFRLAREVNKRARKANIVVPAFIEINSGKEEQKHGIMPDRFEDFIEKIKDFSHIKVEGIMTMGPIFENPEELRPYFKLTRELYERAKKIKQENLDIKWLSMGMTDSYLIAIDEGANMIRIGTALFGPRD